jgi:hypothetical protein
LGSWKRTELPVVQDLARPSVWGQDMHAPTEGPARYVIERVVSGVSGLPREARYSVLNCGRVQ